MIIKSVIIEIAIIKNFLMWVGGELSLNKFVISLLFRFLS